MQGPAPAQTSWWTHFEPNGAFHATTVLVCVGLIGATCWAGRRLAAGDRSDGGRREWRLRCLLGWSFLAWQAGATVWRLLPGQFDLGESLPLHLCRITGVVAPLALLTMNRRLRAITYFWGLGLSTQGFATPMWSDGLGTVAFWLYWVGHCQIVGIAIYDVTVHAYRPRLPDLAGALRLGVVFALGVTGANLLLGTNYCYLGAGSYDAPSIVDAFGPWPQRWFVLVGVASAWLGALYGVAVGVGWVKTRVPTPALPDAPAVAGTIEAKPARQPDYERAA